MSMLAPCTRRKALAAVSLLLVGGGAHALSAPPEVQHELGAARLQGSGRLRFFGLLIYDARLWTAAPLTAETWAQVPLALELTYARALDGHEIAARSLKEMRRQGDIDAASAARWLVAMKAAFPDVRAGDRLTGVYRPDGALQLFVNGKPHGELPAGDFARLFIGIWLSPRTSEPALRNALLGAAASGTAANS